MQQTAHSSLPNTAGFAHPAGNALRFGIMPGMSIADFGAGSGHYVWPMAEALCNSGTLYAIDIQKDLLHRIHNEAQKRGHKNVKVIWADLEKPKAAKIMDQSIDIVLISNLLFQLENKHAVLSEARRILKPAGKLIVIDWSESFGGMGPHKKEVVTKEAGLELLQAAGFKVSNEFRAGAHHWGVIAQPHA